MQRLADGVWRWTARHPEWHRNDGWADEVASFALRADGLTLLIDPLVVDGAGWEELDGVVSGPVETLITIPYHARSAGDAQARYGGSVWGHPAVAKRLHDRAVFREMRPGDPLPAGVSAHRIGRPVRYETPLFVPGLQALVFGDAVVGTAEGPRVWITEPLNEKRATWYEQRLLPTLLPLADLHPACLLMTHGPSVLDDGERALRDGFASPPFFHAP
ncbi:MAG: hypothetical protein ACTHNU_11185 [Gaiellales bacterium]